MTIGANSYGSTDGVAVLTPRYAGTGAVFTETTRPTLATVVGFIDQVSGMLNGILAQNGFAIPVSQADAKLALDLFVNQEVADMVEGVNGLGRFGPASKERGSSRFKLINSDLEEFIATNVNGFERLGATRTYSVADGFAYRETDESGDEVEPLFQRDAFGNVVDDWDTD